MNRRHVTRVVVGAVLSALLVAPTAAQDLPSTTTDGMSLTSEETTALLNKLKGRLDSLGLASDWVDALIADPPAVVIEDDIGKNQAMYQPAGLGVFWPVGNTLYLKPGLNLTDLSASQMGVITHEFWHAWFDFVPIYNPLPFLGSSVSELSDAQEEAVGGFIEELVGGSTLPAAIGRAVQEATHEDRGGTAQDAIHAIMIVEEALLGSFFGSRLSDTGVGQWLVMRQVGTPEAAQLEQFLSELDLMRIEALADERARLAELPPPDEAPAGTAAGGETASAAGAPAETPSTGTTPASGTRGGAGVAVDDLSFPDVERVPEPGPPTPIPYPNIGESSDTARSGRPEAPEADDPEPPAVADPDCDQCDPIARKLRDALQRRQDLQAESDRVNHRLGEIPGELNQAQQTRQELQNEFDRRLRDTSIRSEGVEGRYHQVGDTVYIAIGTSAGGAFAPSNLPGMPGVTPSNQARPSPYMTRLKERIAAAETDTTDLQAEQDQLNDQRKQLDADLAQAQAAVDQLRQELEDCLKRCGGVGSINTNTRLTVASGGTIPASGTGGRAGPSVSIFVGNPTDLLSGLNLYALQTADGVPYAIARPDHDVDDRYQLFIVTFIRAGRRPGPLPETDRRTGDAFHQPRWSPWDRAARSARAWVSGAFNLFAPPVHAFAPPGAPLAPGTLVRFGGTGQDGAAPTLSLVATGASSGDALTLEMLDADGDPVQVVAPDGLVLQAVRQGSGSRVSQAGGSVTTTPVTGFCLEYQKPPPPAETVYQVAPEAVQQRYRPMRSILEAGRLLVEAGLLNPDSDPASYATFIQQWALWTELGDWDEGDFTREFINRTRQNVENGGQQFTDQMRDALQGAAPNRFNDILTVLVEAEGVTGRSPFALDQ